VTIYGEPKLNYGVLTSGDLQRFAGFSCGDEEWADDLNAFLREDALREAEGRYNTTYVFYDLDRQPVAYVTLSCSEVKRESRDDHPYPNVPALLIGRLAVDHRHQGKGYGELILRWIRNMGLELPMGCRFLALHVDARNERALAFYRRHGFIEPPIGNRRLRLLLYDLVS
jgi:GNAT superfamily N-acetyltransferase